MTLVYIAGYIDRHDEGKGDSTMYYSKYGDNYKG